MRLTQFGIRNNSGYSILLICFFFTATQIRYISDGVDIMNNMVVHE